jgi:ABC-type phosphate transport system auxiliary subunit
MKLFNVRLQSIARKSAKAIGQFVTTEKLLQKQNEELDRVINEIDADAHRLTLLFQDAKARKAENDGIIKRIGQIIRG